MNRNVARATIVFVVAALFAPPMSGAEDEAMLQAWERLPAAEELYQKGLRELAAGRREASSAAFERCLQGLPRHAFARYQLAVLRYARKDLLTALDQMVRALEDLPFMYELNDYAVKKKSRSLESYEMMLAEGWENAASCREAREIESLSRESADAKSKLEFQALRERDARSRKEASFHYFLGNIYFQLQRFPEALREYDEAIDHSARLAEAYNNAAAIRFMAGDAPRALDYLERAEGRGVEERLSLELKYLVHEALGRPTDGILQEDLAPGAETDVSAVRLALAVKSEDVLKPRIYENAYLVFSRSSLDAVLIDPGVEDPRIEELVRSRKLKVVAVLITHGHEDHTGGAIHYSRLFQAPVLIHGRDAGRLTEPPAQTLADGQIVSYPGLSVRVVQTSGHTPGSVCFLIGGYLFTGDTLFRGDIGRVESGDPNDASRLREKLVRTIKGKLLVLPGSLWVCPGHGKISTVADEKAGPPFLAK